jgi:hypothetical protein
VDERRQFGEPLISRNADAGRARELSRRPSQPGVMPPQLFAGSNTTRSNESHSSRANAYRTERRRTAPGVSPSVVVEVGGDDSEWNEDGYVAERPPFLQSDADMQPRKHTVRFEAPIRTTRSTGSGRTQNRNGI